MGNSNKTISIDISDVVRNKNFNNAPLNYILKVIDIINSSLDIKHVLKQLMQDMKKCKGTAVDQYLPMIYGALGENYFHSNQCSDAYDITRKAFEECQRIGDMEGIIAYCGNLSEICKRLGKNDEEKKWLIMTSNIMIQIGQSENAAQLRSSIGIEPTSELITVRNFPD